MDAGDELRLKVTRGMLANAAIAEIASHRERQDERVLPRLRAAWLLDSLKHPAEVEVLRRVYGPGFYLVGIFRSESERREELMLRGLAEIEAEELLKRDAAASLSHGQQTRKCYELADAWVNSKEQLERFLGLVFGNVLETPTEDENAMAVAYTSALRSGDLSRQVGAVITLRGEIVATGCNEVPCPGGGQYLPPTVCSPSQRDIERGYDANTIEKIAIQSEIATAVSDKLSSSLQDLLQQGLQQELNHEDLRKFEQTAFNVVASELKQSRVADLTEFGRAVHAEMAALMAAARLGSSVQGGTLYSTTFPCHNCAKHIIAAGIQRVVYVEPYPKSRARALHSDAITLSGEDSATSLTKVVFESFVGVGPRRYFDLFSLRLGDGREIKRKDEGGRVVPFVAKGATPRVELPVTNYLEEELEAVALSENARAWRGEDGQ